MTHPGFLVASLYVAVGGAAGAWLRFAAGRLLIAWLGPVRAAAFPWATLTVNIIGSLAMGVLIGWLARSSGAGALTGEPVRLLLAVGLLGGFTTFSAFSLELVTILQRGEPGLAAAYAVFSVLAGVAALFAGLALARTT